MRNPHTENRLIYLSNQLSKCILCSRRSRWLVARNQTVQNGNNAARKQIDFGSCTIEAPLSLLFAATTNAMISWIDIKKLVPTEIIIMVGGMKMGGKQNTIDFSFAYHCRCRIPFHLFWCNIRWLYCVSCDYGTAAAHFLSATPSCDALWTRYTVANYRTNRLYSTETNKAIWSHQRNNIPNNSSRSFSSFPCQVVPTSVTPKTEQL